MIRTSKIALAVAIAAMGIAAQSFGAGPATAASHHTVAAHKIRHHSIAAPQSGLYAYDALVPALAGGNSLSPLATGGGSFGYNENIRRDEW